MILFRVIVLSEKEKDNSDEVLGATTVATSSRSAGGSKSRSTKSSSKKSSGGATTTKWWRSAEGQREKEKALRLLSMTLDLGKLWDQSKIEERFFTLCSFFPLLWL